ncbi:C4-dicarboxylate TRAP transporter substrate-binding protein [Selenomonas sp. TAMA-11512]|uniref:C4-dicarboxylate TRAP transporter substrate-binding protein n=1 Tax=Selenomonas sp. TAMA-11512 TaxID=3095337 RepID=UPI00309068C1|nr:C4-dicarboxylate TRAP transporter substrate-binding protein [Selenomonas sp. TAMA-11512]
MNRRLKFFLGVMLLICMTIVGGCGGGGDKQQASDSKEKVVLRIGYENNPGEPLDVALNKWKELVAKKSNGQMELELYPSSQLGSKNDLIDQMIVGEPVMTLANGAWYADRGVKDFGIMFAPYLFDNWDQVWKVVGSDWYKEQSAKVEEKGIKIVSNWIYGTRHLALVKPYSQVSDLKGQKIRVPNNTIQVESFKALGIAPTPMPLGEAYTALQQGTIDGLENSLQFLDSAKYGEVVKYVVLDGHIRDLTSWVCGKTFWESLTKEQQDILTSTAEEASKYNSELQDAADKKAMEELKAQGVTIIEPDMAMREQFKQESEGFYSSDAAKDWSPGLREKILNIIKM